jgi:hypothetical protein
LFPQYVTQEQSLARHSFRNPGNYRKCVRTATWQKQCVHVYTHTHAHTHTHDKMHIPSIYNFDLKVLSEVYSVITSQICTFFIRLVKISHKISTQGNKWLRMDRQGHPVILHSSL